MNTTQTHHIRICMGSSCYCRGNSKNAELIQEALENQGLDSKVQLTGTLCEGRCKDGPILSLDDHEYCQVQPGMAADLVEHLTLHLKV